MGMLWVWGWILAYLSLRGCGLEVCGSKMCESEVRWGRSCVDRRWGVVKLRNESTGKGNSPWVCVWVELGLPWGRGSVWVRCSLSLSLSLSLSHVWDPKMVCSENRNVNQFPGQSHKTHSQLKCFSEKFYFPCATKHIVMCKIISWNGFMPKQMQP